jgi:hypothetical protein
LVKGPACLIHQQIDEGVARFGFGIVVCVGLRGCGAFRFGDFGAELLQFLIELVLAGEYFREFFIAVDEVRCELLKLFDRLPRYRGGFREQQRIERQGGDGPGGAGIGAGEPVADVKEFTDGGERVDLLDGSVAVNGTIAEADDDLRFGENGFACCSAERRFMG